MEGKSSFWIYSIVAKWRCLFVFAEGHPRAGQSCGEPATYGGFCDAHTCTAVETCLCGAPALGEAALAGDMYTAHPTLCEDCAASDYIEACGMCGRLGTEEASEQHGFDAHYYMRPTSTTATSEEVTQCFVEEKTGARRPMCIACGYVSSARRELRQHIIEHHLANIGQDPDFVISHVCSNWRCEPRHMTTLGVGAYCDNCVTMMPTATTDRQSGWQWKCRRCKYRQIDDPVEHFASHHALVTVMDRGGSKPALTDWECGVCHAVVHGGIDVFLEDHFLRDHVSNMGCPLPDCPRSGAWRLASPWASDALSRHIIEVHREHPTLVPGVRSGLPCFVRNAFSTAQKRDPYSTTVGDPHIQILPSMLYNAAQLRKATVTALSEYALLLGCEGPLLRELCWGRDAEEWNVRKVVIEHFSAITESRCIPVGSRKSYDKLPEDMWRVIMGQLSCEDAVALGMTCSRLRDVYMGVWGRSIDAICDLVLPTLNIERVLDIRTGSKVDSATERSHWGILPREARSGFLIPTGDLEDRVRGRYITSVQAFGSAKVGPVYPVRALAHAALQKYGSVEAFKKEKATHQAKQGLSHEYESGSDSSYDWGSSDGSSSDSEGSV